MANDFFPWGTGFGAFERTFLTYEPTELLRDTYVNQAHNDLMQFIIEGGLGAAAILTAFIIWFVFTGYKMIGRDVLRDRPDQVVSIVIILFLLAGSLVDYPLRTPMMMAILAICCTMMSVSGGVVSKLSSTRVKEDAVENS
jgi:O-antigen ligase